MSEANDSTTSGNLLSNCVLFGRMLRALGVEITPTQVVDLVDSLHYVNIGSRQDFKNSARTVLISRREHLPLFDEAFDLFWQARGKTALLQLDLSELLQKQEKQQQEEVYRRTPATEQDKQTLPEEEPEEERVLTYSDLEILRQKDFSRLDEEEMAAVRRLMLQTQWQLEPRRTRRTVNAKQGDLLDLRRTIRQNLRHGGEMLRLAHKERKFKRRPVVLICDISGSMERYSRVLLQFIYVVTSRLDRVESFVFSTRLTRITRELRRRNIDEALREASAVVHAAPAGPSRSPSTVVTVTASMPPPEDAWPICGVTSCTPVSSRPPSTLAACRSICVPNPETTPRTCCARVTRAGPRTSLRPSSTPATAASTRSAASRPPAWAARRRGSCSRSSSCWAPSASSAWARVAG